MRDIKANGEMREIIEVGAAGMRAVADELARRNTASKPWRGKVRRR